MVLFQTVSAFETEFFISGLAPLADQLVTLYFVKENSDHMVMMTSFKYIGENVAEKLLLIVCVFICVCVCVQDEEFRARPRLDIIQPLPESCEEISSDALTVRNFQDNECRDYRLGETIKTALGEMSRSFLLRADFIMHRLIKCQL